MLNISEIVKKYCGDDIWGYTNGEFFHTVTFERNR